MNAFFRKPVVTLNWIIGIALLLGAATANAESKTIEGYEFPETMEIGEQKVPLYHATLLTFWGFKVYAIGLYAPEGSEVEEIVQTQVPVALHIHYFRDFNREDIIKAARKILSDNPEVAIEDYEDELAQINRLYKSVEAGDRYTLAYDAKTSATTLSLNNNALGTVNGADFARIYFGIWLSEHPIDEDLRDRLLKLDED